MQILKSLIQGCLRPLGVQLYKPLTPQQLAEQEAAAAEQAAETARQIAEAERKRTLWLRNMAIKTILDIGANTGQFTEEMYQIFSEATIYAFEPLPDCYQKLLVKFSDRSTFKAFNIALGNEAGQVTMYRNQYSPSSSLRMMANLHKESFPYTKIEVEETINIVTLDEVSRNLQLHKPLLIKLDVQGYEDQVILGGINTIRDADILIIELSMEPLYQQQPLFDDIYRILINLGFQYRGNMTQLHHSLDGRVLQVDGIFIK